MWLWVRCERAERPFNPLLNQPGELLKSALLAFCFSRFSPTKPGTISTYSRRCATGGLRYLCSGQLPGDYPPANLPGVE